MGFLGVVVVDWTIMESCGKIYWGRGTMYKGKERYIYTSCLSAWFGGCKDIKGV